jgi:VCBS repeat protein/IPT/TIG domain-containing protein
MKPLHVSLFAAIVLSATLANAANAVPFVNQPLVPASVAPGGSGFTLTVNGTGFVSGSTVNWNGSPRTTTFISSSQVTAAILSSDIATATTASVTVVSPAPGGGRSNVVFLPVREPATFVSLNSSSFGVPLGAGPSAVADFNNDGNQDLALLETNPPEVFILLGNGNGTFNPATNTRLPAPPPSTFSPPM